MFSGPGEWIIIALVVIVLFGGKKIPELARGLGKSIQEFKRARDEIKDEIDDSLNENQK
ncbi:MAG: twin-arginine translocase TatA/TatE family subunit [Pelagibacteraceae bacterium TMED237]|nr:twin-arginine translocase TatA/TatE family subunit [Candidatus Neomarinimicrobiota bacterium]OUW96619.1 MAG: twin-arginine translocase TatA/TatE family subunit [Pelagibacteraceae bacterium TMED237]|tara:strand:- start:29 stop:205 length:177 start_codon:yes stop_codon:yes gene_type:complete